MALSYRALSMVAATLLAGFGARAADLPSPGAPLPPAPAIAPSDPWSGPWVGVYGGYGWTNPNGSFNIVGGDFVNDLPPSIANPVDASGSGAISASGFLGGVQGGWNLRLTSEAIVGVEADVSYAGLHGGRSAGGTVNYSGLTIPYSVSQHVSTDWQAAVRARAGYLINPSTLLFVEAGPALGRIHYGGSFGDWVPDPVDYAETENASGSATKLGLTLGGGVEYLVSANLSVRAEYLYTRFPSVNMTGQSNALFPNPVPATVAHNSGALNQNTFKIGVNYFFR